jgi:hypothetical protein
MPDVGAYQHKLVPNVGNKFLPVYAFPGGDMPPNH